MEMTEAQITAYHEAGHAYVYWRHRRKMKTVSIMAQDGTLGAVTFRHTQAIPYSLSGLRRIVAELFAGVAAEIIFCGQSYSLDDRATDLGIDGSDMQCYAQLMRLYSDRRKTEATAGAGAYLDRTFRQPAAAAAVHALASALLERGTLTGEECAAVISEAFASHQALTPGITRRRVLRHNITEGEHSHGYPKHAH
jgi:hypothetical protein